MNEQVPFWWVVVAFIIPQVVAFATVRLGHDLEGKREHKRWLTEKRAAVIEDAIAHAWRSEQSDKPVPVDFERVERNAAAMMMYRLDDFLQAYLEYLRLQSDTTSFDSEPMRQAMTRMLAHGFDALGVSPLTDKDWMTR